MYPIIFEIGPFSLSTLWFFAVIGFIIATKLFLTMTQKRKLKLNIFFENSLLFMIVPILIGRLIGILNYIIMTDFFNLKDFLLGLFTFWDQKFSFWGAFLSFIILLILALKKKGQDVLPWIDSISIPLLIGMAIANIGKYLSGEGYGKPTNLPFGVTYENIDVYYTVPVHPTQMYQFLYITIIILACIYINKNHILFERTGNLGLYSMLSFSFFRFIEEFFRGDNVIMFGPIRLPQIIALIFTIVFAILISANSKRKLNI